MGPDTHPAGLFRARWVKEGKKRKERRDMDKEGWFSSYFQNVFSQGHQRTLELKSASLVLERLIGNLSNNKIRHSKGREIFSRGQNANGGRSVDS